MKFFTDDYRKAVKRNRTTIKALYKRQCGIGYMSGKPLPALRTIFDNPNDYPVCHRIPVKECVSDQRIPSITADLSNLFIDERAVNDIIGARRASYYFKERTDGLYQLEMQCEAELARLFDDYKDLVDESITKYDRWFDQSPYKIANDAKNDLFGIVEPPFLAMPELSDADSINGINDDVLETMQKSGLTARDYQNRIIHRMMTAYKERSQTNNLGTLVGMATGAGKTALAIMLSCYLTKLKPDIRIAFVVPGKDLFQQWLEVLMSFDIGGFATLGAGCKTSGSKNYNILLATAQTIRTMMARGDHIPPPHVAFHDEAHIKHGQYFIDAWRKAGTFNYGLTATPYDHELLDFYDQNVITDAEAQTWHLQSEGVLCKYNAFVPKAYLNYFKSVRDDIKERNSDMSFKDIQNETIRVSTVEYMTKVLEYIGSRTSIDKTIVYAASTNHAHELQSIINRHYGKPVAGLFLSSQDDTPYLSKSVMDKLMDGVSDYKIAVCYRRFREGYNHPGVRNIIWAKNLGTKKALVQSLGRGLRADPNDASKVLMAFDLGNNLPTEIKRMKKYRPELIEHGGLGMWLSHIANQIINIEPQDVDADDEFIISDDDAPPDPIINTDPHDFEMLDISDLLHLRVTGTLDVVEGKFGRLWLPSLDEVIAHQMSRSKTRVNPFVAKKSDVVAIHYILKNAAQRQTLDLKSLNRIIGSSPNIIKMIEQRTGKTYHSTEKMIVDNDHRYVLSAKIGQAI